MSMIEAKTEIRGGTVLSYCKLLEDHIAEIQEITDRIYDALSTVLSDRELIAKEDTVMGEHNPRCDLAERLSLIDVSTMSIKRRLSDIYHTLQIE